jgi:hypothetical protein
MGEDEDSQAEAHDLGGRGKANCCGAARTGAKVKKAA